MMDRTSKPFLNSIIKFTPRSKKRSRGHVSPISILGHTYRKDSSGLNQ